VSRSLIVPLQWSFLDYDGFDVFSAVRVPTLVLHRRDDALVPVEQARWIARQVPDARLIELSGSDHLPFVGDSEEVLANVEAFLGGSPGAAASRRRLLTIVVADIAGSTESLSGLRDDARRQLVANHHELVKSHFLRFGGEWLKQLSDAALAAFDGPARAVRCALGISEATERLGLALRIGVHTGECELDDGDVYGIALNLATHIAKLAAPGEILVSSTVRDLVSGSGLRFADAREIEIAGNERRVVFPVLVHGIGADAARRLAVEQANLLRRDGEYWTLAYDGQVAAIRDTKGVRDLARLLASPHHELHVLDLAAEARTPAMQQRAAATVAPGDVHADESEPILDDTARSQYKQRISELEQYIDDAEARGDGAASESARRELEAIVDNLTAAYGLRDRPRRMPDRIERARKAVTRRVRDAIGRMARVHPSLGRHLDTSIRTGVFCCYAPERDVHWTIEEM
jgi:class 3 adenylate cyclase